MKEEPDHSDIWKLQEVLYGECRRCFQMADLPWFHRRFGYVCAECREKLI